MRATRLASSDLLNGEFILIFLIAERTVIIFSVLWFSFAPEFCGSDWRFTFLTAAVLCNRSCASEVLYSREETHHQRSLVLLWCSSSQVAHYHIPVRSVPYLKIEAVLFSVARHTTTVAKLYKRLIGLWPFIFVSANFHCEWLSCSSSISEFASGSSVPVFFCCLLWFFIVVIMADKVRVCIVGSGNWWVLPCMDTAGTFSPHWIEGVLRRDYAYFSTHSICIGLAFSGPTTVT